MNKLIRVLMALATSILVFSLFFQCSKQNENVKLLYLKNDPYYSFIIKTPKTLLYSTPSFFELKSNTIQNEKNIIFEEELKKFKPYHLTSQKKYFDNVYVSNVLGETNFSVNHFFEYDFQLNKTGKVKTNIYFPYNLKGSYEFELDKENKDLFYRTLYSLSLLKIKKNIPDANLNNVIILQNNNTEKIYGGNEYIYNNPEYSLILALVNKILLENLDKKTNKIKNFNIPSIQFIKRLPPPPTK